jgi:AraC-like DNA-binding protein
MNAVVPIAPHRADTVEAYRNSIERVIRHMKANLAEPLDLDQLATIAAISKFHLVRVFDELTGTTPRHFLSCLRMQRAKELLFSSPAGITEICLEVGYSSMGSFSRIFSDLVGLSPQEFRAMPKRLTTAQFARAIWRYLASRRKFSGPTFDGIVDGPARPRGFTFVGAFTGGVPQGVPDSGTVLIKHGTFRLQCPKVSEFHLMAVLVPFSAKFTDMAANLPVGLVASLRLRTDDLDQSGKPCLHLRPMRTTDPPIVLALPALPPLREI